MNKRFWSTQMEIHNALNLLLLTEEELSHLCTIIVTVFLLTSPLWTHALFILKQDKTGLFWIKSDISDGFSSSASKGRK